jgi:hypothetical protein
VRVSEIVDRENALDLLLRHGAQHVAPDAAETVDSVISHKFETLSVKALKRKNAQHSTFNVQRSTSNSGSLGVGR